MSYAPSPNQPFVRLRSGTELLNFVWSAPIVVVHVHLQIFDLSNVTVAESLKHSHGVRCARILRDSLDTSHWFFQQAAGTQLRALGLPADRLLPGYYLISNKRLFGWHPCALSQQKRDLGVIISTAYGLLSGFATNDVLRGLSDGIEFYFRLSAQEALRYFATLLKEASRQANAHARAQQQQAVIRTKLQQAQQLLGVSANATLGEIKRAYRAKVREHHPDGASTEDEVARRTARMAEFNLARELLETALQSQKGEARKSA